MQRFHIHAEHPQANRIAEIAGMFAAGGVVALPLESGFVLATTIDNVKGMQAIRTWRQLGKRHLFTLLCKDISTLTHYAKVSNALFRPIRQAVPGSYMFILPATPHAPKRLLHEKRNTVGVRIPPSAIVQALLAELPVPLKMVSFKTPEITNTIQDYDMAARIGQKWGLDAIIEGEGDNAKPTIIDGTTTPPAIVREGAGSLAVFGVH